MATAFQQYIASLPPVPDTPAIISARAKLLDDRKAQQAQDRALLAEEKRIRETRNDRACAISAALIEWHKKERRQGSSPDAAGVESKTAEVMHIDFDEDGELHCAMCDGENITLGARHGADEFGVEDSEDAAWCWDCSAVTEAVEIALPAATLCRIFEAVAA